MSTQFLDDIYARVDFDRDLVFKFFTVFSLFEYGLKATGYLRSNSEEAQPYWRKFARDIAPNFNPSRTPELLAAYEYMIEKPVKKQMVRNNYLSFENQTRQPNLTDTEWLSFLIRSVRNNLFHGGKFAYERPRDTELITNSLILLEEFVRLHQGIQQELHSISLRR